MDKPVEPRNASDSSNSNKDFCEMTNAPAGSSARGRITLNFSEMALPNVIEGRLNEISKTPTGKFQTIVVPAGRSVSAIQRANESNGPVYKPNSATLLK